MSRFSTGKNSFAISDRSGLRYRYKDMRREWNGLLVGRDEFEPKQPQLGPFRKVVDAQALKMRDRIELNPRWRDFLTPNAFTSGSAASAVITVFEPSHGRSTSDTVRFRNVFGFDGFTKATIENASGYVITVTTTDEYTFTAASGTATTGNTRGGGENATVGPVTLVS